MERRHRSRRRHATHGLSDFVIGDFVIFEGNIVAEEMATDLISNADCKEDSPSNPKDHVVGDSACSEAAQLIMPAKIIECSSADRNTMCQES